MIKNVVIEKLGINGEGVARVLDKVYFVPRAIPGDVVNIKVTKDKGRYAYASVVEMITLSSDRVEPRCKYYESCGGCHIQHINYLKQLEYKTGIVRDTIVHNAGVDVDINNTIGSYSNFGYRNKVSFTVMSQNGVTKVGLLQEDSNTLVEIDKCEIADAKINESIGIVRDFIEKYKIEAYDYNKKVGLLRNVVIRVLEDSVLITMVATTKNIPSINNLVTMLSALDSFGLDININKGSKGRILSNRFVHVAGIDKLYGLSGGVRYPISSYSFMQVNDDIKDKIYDAIVDSIPKDNIVIDAYSGAGLLSNIIAKKCKYVYAIEIIEEATKNSVELSEYNSIKNIESICGDVAEVLPKILKNIDKDKVTIVLDPPRVGCDKKVLDTIMCSGIKKILYVSCNVATLSRDIKILKDKYNVDSVTPYDMFPNTKHIEVLTKFTKI